MINMKNVYERNYANPSVDPRQTKDLLLKVAPNFFENSNKLKYDNFNKTGYNKKKFSSEKVNNKFICDKFSDVFNNEIKENHENEQFFWTKNTVELLLKACQYEYNCCCFTTPSLAHAFYENGRNEALLDIDERFNYLPGFMKFDIKDPHSPESEYNIIVIDPPFFVTSIQQLYDATEMITGGNKNVNIMIGFLTRYEKTLLEVFKSYGISETSTPLEYAHIKPNKWKNFTLYSNIDLPGIKRIPGKVGYKSANNLKFKI